MSHLAAAGLRPLTEGATDAVLDSAWFESLLADALDSEQVQAALRKALETEGAEHVVASLFESGLIDEFVDRLVSEGTVWSLIDAILTGDGAERVVANPALSRLIDKALEGEGAKRLVNSEALWALVDRALRTDHGDRLVRDEALWHLINRALESEGAARLVENRSLWVLVDGALRSEGATQLVNSTALWGLIDKALESEGAAELVAKLFDIGLSDQFVDRLLTSPAVWRLVDKIAASPAVTAAISQQGLGFADQVGNELRARCREADGQILRAVDRHRPHRSRASVDGTAPPPDQADHPGTLLPAPMTTVPTDGAGSTSAPAAQAVIATVGSDARQADAISRSDRSVHNRELSAVGVVIRSVSWVIDAVLISVVAIMAGLGTSLIVSMFPIARSAQPLLTAIAGAVFILWSAGYFVVFWSTTGQTPGARVMQIRLVSSAEGKVKPTSALVRWVAMNLSALMLFAGYVPLLFKRRALPDYLARTLVLEAPQASLVQVRQEALRAARDRALTDGARAADLEARRATVHEPL